MTTRKPRIEAAPQPALPKSVPYPPAAIWKTKEDGADFSFRGNTFVRRGDRVARVFEPASGTPTPAAESKTSGG
jgi:hypothetical protein